MIDIGKPFVTGRNEIWTVSTKREVTSTLLVNRHGGIKDFMHVRNAKSTCSNSCIINNRSIEN